MQSKFRGRCTRPCSTPTAPLNRGAKPAHHRRQDTLSPVGLVAAARNPVHATVTATARAECCMRPKARHLVAWGDKVHSAYSRLRIFDSAACQTVLRVSRTGIGWQPPQIQGDPLYPSESQRSQMAPAQPRRQAHRVLFDAQWMLPSIVPVGLQWPHGVTARDEGSV